jgi:signal transduction histidine kinase
MRLTLWYVAVLALVLCVASVAIYAAEQRTLLAQLDGRISDRLRQLAGSYDLASGRLTAAADGEVAQGGEIVLLLTPGGRIVQVQAAGPLSAVKLPWDQVVQSLLSVARSGNGTVVEKGLTIAMPSAASKYGSAPTTVNSAAIYRLTGVPLTVGDRVAALLVVGIRSDVAQQMAALAQTLETVVPLTLILCAGGGFWLAHRALRPVRTITHTAQGIGATDLGRRLSLRSDDELGRLGATFDRMLDRLEAAFERERQFTADASHELRTPLAIVDLEASRALARERTTAEYRRAIAVMQQEAGYMSRLVDDLLLLARADSGQAVLQREQVDLSEIILDVAERLAPLAQRSAMRLCIETLPELGQWGDRAGLSRVLMNLIENALKYGAGRGTQVRIAAGFRPLDAVPGIWLQVADDGPGIAAEHLPHLCERFYRVDQARTRGACAAEPDAAREVRPTGSGLGLAISRWIVTAHGGRLDIRSDFGHGTTAEIWLPVGGTPQSRAAVT